MVVEQRVQTATWPIVWSDVAAYPPIWVQHGEHCQVPNFDEQPCPRQPVGLWQGRLTCDRHWPSNLPKPGQH